MNEHLPLVNNHKPGVDISRLPLERGRAPISTWSRADTGMLQEEVRECCVWREGKSEKHHAMIDDLLASLSDKSDHWWRVHCQRPVGWWLDFAGIPGYEVYRAWGNHVD